MAKGYETSLTVWENDGWFDTGTSDPFLPLLESEGLIRQQIFVERNSMVRNTRSTLSDSLILEESKPQGHIEFVPRLENCSAIFMSHFQMSEQVDTGSSFIDTFVPSKTHPRFSGGDTYGDGTYGAVAGDVYSIDIIKQFPDYRHHVGENAQHFKRGLCDELSFSMAANEDFKIKADFKFKDWASLSGYPKPGETGAGTYTSGTITEGYHGTWSIEAAEVGEFAIESGLSSINITCRNNLTEKKSPGSGTRQTFSYGNYTVKGDFTSEFIFDEWQDLTADGFDAYFPIHGTIWHNDTDYMIIEMPHCKVKNVEQSLSKPEELFQNTIPFEAYENDGTAPIKVTLHTTKDALPDLLLWDAGFGARTLAQYDFADAGSIARTLSEYDFADRDV
jgi:hypothetical protein